MARTVAYSVSPRVNPQNKEAAPKYYGHTQATGDVNVREMSTRIQAACTVTKADVYAVLVALEDVIIEALKAGEIVRLGDLGTFQIGISTKGAETEDKFDVSNIVKSRIRFRPGMALAEMLNSLSFTKVAVKNTKDDDEKEEDDNSGESDGGTTGSDPTGGNSGTGTNGSDDDDDPGTNDDGGADFN